MDWLTIVKPFVFSTARTIATGWGVWLASHEGAAAVSADTITGAILVMFAVGWSALDKHETNQVKQTLLDLKAAAPVEAAIIDKAANPPTPPRGSAISVFLAVLLTMTLGACQVTIPNVFGGPPLILTGSLTNDRAGIEAFAASVKAGVKADAETVRGWFVQLCPSVTEAQQLLNDPMTQATIQRGAATVGLSENATNVQINNINQGLTLGTKFCIAGTATNLQTAFFATLDAIRAIESLIKIGSSL